MLGLVRTKKAIVLIVEGITDEMIFQTFIDQMLEKHDLTVKIVHGDAFSDYWNSSKAPKLIIGDIMKEVREQTKFQLSDIVFIAQIIDIDGIYIPEEDFAVDSAVLIDAGKTYVYSLETTQVITKNTQNQTSLKRTWAEKKKKVETLKSGFSYSSANIPYMLFYNSLTLEHVTNGKISKQEDKNNEAFNFILNLEQNIENYLSFFQTKDESSSFKESWDKLHSEHWSIPKSNIKYLNDKIQSLENG